MGIARSPGTEVFCRRFLLFAVLLAPMPTPAGSRAETAELTVGGRPVVVEIAADAASRRQGLMFRKHLPADRGMLFIWPDAAPRGMWMKNTLIALDVAFIDDEHRIVNIETMRPQTTRPHRAARPVRYALEMNAGWFARQRIEPGDRVAGLGQAASRADSPTAARTSPLRSAADGQRRGTHGQSGGQARVRHEAE